MGNIEKVSLILICIVRLNKDYKPSIDKLTITCISIIYSKINAHRAPSIIQMSGTSRLAQLLHFVTSLFMRRSDILIEVALLWQKKSDLFAKNQSKESNNLLLKPIMSILSSIYNLSTRSLKALNFIVICHMEKRLGILAVAFFAAMLTMAQIPELDSVKTNTTNPNQKGIEKARAVFYNGENQLAETLFFTELEEGNFDNSDFLLFANSLVRDNKPALAKESYTTYFSSIKNSQQKDQLSQILSQKKGELERTAISKNDVYSPTLYQDKLYGTKAGKVYSYTFDCDQNIENKTELDITASGMTVGSISFFNNGNSAVASFLSSKTNKYGLYINTVQKRKMGLTKKIDRRQKQ